MNTRVQNVFFTFFDWVVKRTVPMVGACSSTSRFGLDFLSCFPSLFDLGYFPMTAHGTY